MAHVLTDSTCSNLNLSLNACILCTLCPRCWTWHRAGWDPDYHCGTALSRATLWPLSFSLASNTANCCWVNQTRQKHTWSCAKRWQDPNLRLFPIHSAPDFANAHYYVHVMFKPVSLDPRPKYRIESPMKIWLWMPKSWVLKIVTTSGNAEYLRKLILIIKLNSYSRL